MKRSKREENGIIIHFVFYFVLTILLVIFAISNILPQIKQIENDKSITKYLYNNILRIESAGLTFEEFKSLNSNKAENRVITEILKNMTDEFYNNNLVNTTSASYSVFLENKNKELNSDENKLIAYEKNKQIINILPSYSEESVTLGEEVLTDYKFINYVESIIESFNFSTTNSIGISKLVLLDDFAVSNNEGDALDSNIYYIPLNLVLQGTKAGIIDFLYFIENVGNITVSDKNIYLNDNYSFLSKNGVKKVLEGDKYTSDYNIFEHQIIDIDRITMNEYIDSSYSSRGDLDFKDFIINTQGNDKYEISVNLMFYVKGQPSYKIEEYITQVLDKHKEILGLVNKLLEDTTLKGIERIKLSKDNDVIKELSKEILSMRKILMKKENLEELYKRTIKIDSIIDPIFKNLQSIIGITKK